MGPGKKRGTGYAYYSYLKGSGFMGEQGIWGKGIQGSGGSRGYGGRTYVVCV